MATELTTRDRLVGAAAGLMHSRGYEAVGVAEVCVAADARKGSFYHHFDSKEDLALAVIERAMQDNRKNVFEPAFGDRSRPVAERFAVYSALLADSHRRMFEEGGQVRGCRLGNFAIEVSTTHPRIQRRVQAALETITEYFASALRDGVEQGDLPADLDTWGTAEAICAHMEGLLVMAKARNDPELLSRLADDAMRLARG